MSGVLFQQRDFTNRLSVKALTGVRESEPVPTVFVISRALGQFSGIRPCPPQQLSRVISIARESNQLYTLVRCARGRHYVALSQVGIRSDGRLQGYCRECARSYRHNYYDSHRNIEIAKAVAYIQANPDVRQLVVQNYNTNYKQKVRARKAVQRAILAGRLVPQPCEHCGSTDNIHGHHADYSRPLDVTWLCAYCHGAEHRRLNRGYVAAANHEAAA